MYDSDPIVEFKCSVLGSIEHLGALLDVGCATGEFLAAARGSTSSIAGVEISSRAREEAHRRCNATIWPELERVPPDQVFDTITFWHSLEHFADPYAALSMASEHLSASGSIVVAVPNIDSLQSIVFRGKWFHLDVPRHQAHFSRASLSRLLEARDFMITRFIGNVPRHNSAGWYSSLLGLLGWSGHWESITWQEKATDQAYLRYALVRGTCAVPCALLRFLELALGRPGTMVVVARRCVEDRSSLSGSTS